MTDSVLFIKGKKVPMNYLSMSTVWWKIKELNADQTVDNLSQSKAKRLVSLYGFVWISCPVIDGTLVSIKLHMYMYSKISFKYKLWPNLMKIRPEIRSLVRSKAVMSTKNYEWQERLEQKTPNVYKYELCGDKLPITQTFILSNVNT